jgi:hypothetical protein
MFSEKRFALGVLVVAGLYGATIEEKTAGMRKMAGYFPLYWDEKKGNLYLEVDKLDTEFLYVNSLPAGMGSNDIGLDRGQLGGTRIVRFERSGPKVLLIEPNYRYRAITPDPAGRRAVEQSFAQSVLWGFEVQAEDAGRVLLDATAFFLRDAHGVATALQRAKQGTASIIRSSPCQVRVTSLAPSIREQAFSGSNLRTIRRRSASRCISALLIVTVCKKAEPLRTTSTVARPSPSVRRCSKARAGGRWLSRRQVSPTHGE